MATNSREARRRRIVERGSDRLALITGRVPATPSSPSSPFSLSSPFAVDTGISSQQLTPHDHDQDQDQRTHHHVSDRNSFNVSPSANDKVSEPILLKHDHVTDPSTDSGRNLPPHLSEFEANNNSVKVLASELSEEGQPPPVSSITNLGTEQRSQPQTLESSIFTPMHISSAITASESTRLFCSMAIALLVVLSYIRFPILGSKVIKSILSFRPLYFVLLTNCTVVLARLLSEKPRGPGRVSRGEQKTPPVDGDDWAEKLGRTLEAGLLVQKVIDALFIDCSIYAIIVICGLSLV
ncbi:Transmembrane protein [Quillaja saponaria]|uniref:Transmembrane protein n=1 Tax=Quillaja saponaria TaxID=32244 RepID=A0AAD7LI72_QUISA|nr:Transmembrane protein [Quillaja saponaria]